MMSAKSNDYNATDALVNNHGSAAGPSVQAALPPMAAGIVPSTSQAPLATAMLPGTATGSLGNTGVEYGIPHHGHQRRSTLSADSRGSELGAETRTRSLHSSEDTLTFSPDVPNARRLSPLKREARVRPGSAKRLAVSTPPSRLVRKASSSPGGLPRTSVWPSPRSREPQPAEERLGTIEKALAEHTRMGLGPTSGALRPVRRTRWADESPLG